jgi:hypothetical protein
LETAPSRPEPPAEPIPIEAVADPRSVPPAEPHEAFFLFELLLHDALHREDA